MYYNFRTDPNENNLRHAIKQLAIITQQTAPPKAVVVNKINIEAARAALKNLNLQIPVSSTGGCLRSELWLEV